MTQQHVYSATAEKSPPSGCCQDLLPTLEVMIGVASECLSGYGKTISRWFGMCVES